MAKKSKPKNAKKNDKGKSKKSTKKSKKAEVVEEEEDEDEDEGDEEIDVSSMKKKELLALIEKDELDIEVNALHFLAPEVIGWQLRDSLPKASFGPFVPLESLFLFKAQKALVHAVSASL